MSRGHHFSLRVYYEDTDLAGVVYYANYLKFIERARSEWARSLGVDQVAMKAEGLVFVVRRVEADYLKPAAFDQVLDIETTVETAKGASVVVRQKVSREGALLFEALVTIVAMGLEDGRPRRLPEAMRTTA